MPTEKKEPAYAAIAAEAVEAVASVKDPELRRVAFEKILATLLDRRIPARGTRQGKSLRSAENEQSNRTDRQVKKHKGGPKAFIEELIGDDFFKKQRTIADVKAELANRGHHIPLTSLSGPLQSLTQDRRLRRQKAPGDRKGKKTPYAYSIG